MARQYAGSRGRTLLIAAAIVVLAVLVLVLAVAALRSGDATVGAGPRVPEAAPELIQPEPTPTVAPIELPVLEPTRAALSVSADGAFWRATAGEACATGETDAERPVFERSDDAAAWSNVTPGSEDVREVLWLQGIDSAAAEAVVLVGPECETLVLRTFTAGRFWEPYSETVTGAATVDAAAGTLRTRTAELELPCALPVRSTVAAPPESPVLVCSGQIAWWVGDAWRQADLTNLVAASFAPEADTLLTAREAVAECDGVLLEWWTGPSEQVSHDCVPGGGVQAVHHFGSTVWLWSAAGIESVSLQS